MQLNFNKSKGLVPAIIQDVRTNQVLMLGYMNRLAWQKTLQEKKVTFYSRTKKRLWTKGESSGGYLQVMKIKVDCDQDCLLIKVKPQGPTCHLGNYSCFKERQRVTLQFLSSLYQLIQDRQKELPVDSYTTALFKQGLPKILNKLVEETSEIKQAVEAEGRERTVEEIADFLYHLTVLMVAKDISWEEIINCLVSRQKPSE